MQLLPRIPGYEFVRALGGGPLTCVYAARECATDAACAVKILREEWQDQPTAVQLLRREARAGMAVHHSHLVAIRDAHVARRPYFLVMDLLPGESLRRWLRRDYWLDVATALWITRQTATALAALHRAGFVHADVKPDNIRIVEAGTAMLIDLGFAHRPGEHVDLRRQGYVLGTVNYLAPELCGFSSDGDFRSDLFSLGVTLFEMLTGKLPYPAGTPEQTFRRHRDDTPFDIRRFAGDLPPTVTAFVNRLLQRRPADRPKAAAVVQQLIALEIAAMRRRKAA